MTKIHPTAVVDSAAQIGDGVEIGPYSIIGPDCVIGDRCWIGPHVVLTGNTTLGVENKIFQFASIGEIPQDKKYKGEKARLIIGDRNTIREFTTFNIGTDQGAGVTKIGNDNWFMAYVHIAHDCYIGNDTVFANNAQIAGHVVVGDHAIMGAFAISHQFCRVGPYSIIGMGSVILKDIPPYIKASGNPIKAYGLNSEGMARAGFSTETMRSLKQAYKTLYRQGHTTREAIALIQEQAHQPNEIKELLGFLEAAERGIIR